MLVSVVCRDPDLKASSAVKGRPQTSEQGATYIPEGYSIRSIPLSTQSSLHKILPLHK